MLKFNSSIIIIFFFSFCFAQKGSFLGANFNGWASRYFGDIYYLNRKSSGFGYTISLGVGQFGKRIFDNKTKDLFGRIFNNEELIGAHYYKTSNIGTHLKFNYSYQFDFNKFVKMDVGFCAIIAVYQQKSSYDEYDVIINDIHFQKIINQEFIRLNCAFGFEVETLLRITKKLQGVVGIKLPYYILNPNKFGISKHSAPPLLGLEPILNLGIRYQLKK